MVTHEEAGQDAIAIIGMAGRFPDAETVNDLWRLIAEKRTATRWLSDEELLKAGVTTQELRDPNYVKAALVLPGMEDFDAEFFGFSPQDAAVLDPQHRHFLECCWESLEDCGHVPANFDGAIGVFGGCGMQAYLAYNLLTNPEVVERMGLFLLRHTGNDKDFLTTRVSYLLNLQGPSIGVQTACSTSLVAVHTACQSLISGECDMALAGGASIELPHRRGYKFAEGEILSSEGLCRAFSDDADGTLFGSGVGVVALRRLEDAIADGDNVQAIILASAVNNDGAGKASYLAPSVDGQAQAAAEALGICGVAANEIDYIEAHGTGTLIGDPIELEALSQAYASDTPNHKIRIGSVKSNIGHLDTAAGVASLIKVVKAMHHKTIPQSLNVTKPNSRFNFDDSAFAIALEEDEWSRAGHPRRAGVNSLGVGGTNAHVILEEAPEQTDLPIGNEIEPQLILLSAKTPASLTKLKSKWLRAINNGDLTGSISNSAYTTQVGREHFEYRCAFAAKDYADLKAALLNPNTACAAIGHAARQGRVQKPTFMFPGGGAQYPGACHGLYESNPAFRRAVDDCFAALPEGAPVNLHQWMFARPTDPCQTAKLLSRPLASVLAVFILEYGILKLWQAWGVEPSAVIGHSAGEYAAAVAAGVMRMPDALGVVGLRGQIFEDMPKGGMLAVHETEANAIGHFGDLALDIASVNAGDAVVVSGGSSALQAYRERLNGAGIDSADVHIDVAAHSRMLDPYLERFREKLESIPLREAQLPFVSNLDGTLVKTDTLTNPGYWVRQLRQTVRFRDGLAALAREGHSEVLLEVGPGQTLSSMTRLNADVAGSATPIASTRNSRDLDDDLVVATTAAGELWANGATVKLEALRGLGPHRRVSLPTYAFDHKRHWIEPTTAAQPIGQTAGAAAGTIQRLENFDAWFRHSEWVHREGHTAHVIPGEHWLIFTDGSKFAERVSERLRASGAIVTCVVKAERFSETRANTFTVDAGSEAQIAELFDELAKGDREPSRIVNFWPNSASIGATQSLFETAFNESHRVAKALAQHAPAEPVKWVHVVHGEGERQKKYTALPAMLAGLARVLPRELPWVNSVLLELRDNRVDLACAVDTVLNETAGPNSDTHVVVKDGTRMVETVRSAHHQHRNIETRCALRPIEAGRGLPNRLRENGVYLITGASGGIGMLLAQYLASRTQARLVLISRHDVGDAASWADLATSDNDVARSAYAENLISVGEHGGTVLPIRADVTKPKELEAAIGIAKARFGDIHGVIHAAGKLDDGLIATRTQSEVDAVMGPKVLGALTLNQLLPSGSLDFFAVFSSVSALIGPPGQADYAAANAVLQAIAEGRPDGMCISWGVWSDIGMAARAGGRPADPALEQPERKVHPWLGNRTISPNGTVQYSATLRHGEAWALSDHKVGEREIIPGAAYLDLAYSAISANADDVSIILENANFLSPCQLGPGEACELRTTIESTENAKGKTVLVSIASRSANGSWQTNFEAKCILNRAPNQRKQPRDRSMRCRGAKTPVADRDLICQSKHIDFGARWQVLRSVHHAGDVVVATLELPELFAGDLDDFPCHPGLFDMAATIGLHVVDEAGTGTSLYAPMSADRIEFIAPLQRNIHATARLVESLAGRHAIFDVRIRDCEGNSLIKIDGLMMRAIDPALLTAPSENEAEDKRTPLEQLLDAGIRASDGPAVFERVFDSTHRHQVVASIGLETLVDAVLPRQTKRPGNGETLNASTGDQVVFANHVEARISEMLAELLGNGNVGPHDRMQELGTHSLMVVRLVAKIRKAFGVQLPLSSMWDNPSLRELSEIVIEEGGIDVRQAGDKAGPMGETASEAPASDDQQQRPTSDETARWTPLLKISPAKPKRLPLFCIHGADGNVVAFQPLVGQLSQDNPIYGLEARGADGTRAPHDTIEEMASAYIEAMRAVQPDGPFCLLGYSGGGVIGYEIARQLREEGREIAFLAMVDTLAPDHNPTWRQILKTYVSGLSRERVANSIRQRATQWHQGARTVLGMDGAVEVDEAIENAERSFRDYVRAQSRYRVQRYDGDVVLFRATKSDLNFLSAGETLGWRQHVKGKIELHNVETNHFEILHPPAIDDIARTIAKLMNCHSERVYNAGGRRAKTGTMLQTGLRKAS